jgi:UDP-N-acetylglucosamine--N-acetylmuramyl-(pentapeptide) pyrophosphoryl-undecaprenol N-acetylglucosamine transferase
MAAAIWLKVPAMAFEPNAMPGLANRLVGKRVQAAAVNFPAAAKWFRNCEVTGIPVRPEFFALGAAAHRRRAAPAGLWRLAGRAHLQYHLPSDDSALLEAFRA